LLLHRKNANRPLLVPLCAAGAVVAIAISRMSVSSFASRCHSRPKPKDSMIHKRSLPQHVSLGNPAVLLATWFGIGLLPLAPGTFGALAAIPVGWLVIAYFGWPALLVLAIAVFAVGVWCADVCARRIGVADPSAVVIDEVAAQWLVLLVVPHDPFYYAAAFLAFRVFDIWKPFPVSWAERSFRGGFGVMIDDVFAAGYACLILYPVSLVLGPGTQGLP
jgi:phosphatidylglycerophosphatase A